MEDTNTPYPSGEVPDSSGRQKRQIVVIGGGPAGLSAAHELLRLGATPLVLEAGTRLGGLARTEEYKGYCFDIGGHRFFTKVKLVEKFWNELLGDDMLTRPRKSRILYRSRFFDYPLRLADALRKLGAVETLRCTFSFAASRLRPICPEDNFEAWVSNRFGKRLFQIFFKTYTEKVWGIPCTEIQAEWAEQRIQGLSIATILRNALIPTRTSGVVKTLIHEFSYPRRGPGMLWERVGEVISAGGGSVLRQTPVERIEWRPGAVLAVHSGLTRYSGSHFISTMPITHLIAAMDPPPPAAVREAAAKLKYRDFLTVALMVRGTGLFPDNWIYVHDSTVRVGRIQNYGNWSPEMVPEPGVSCLGLEYFCAEGDDLWTATDKELLALATREVAALGLVRAEAVFDGVVLRVPKAYPVYDATYKAAVEVIRQFVATIPNLQLVGRNGMHRYNNQDHSILTGILAARNTVQEAYDVWSINADSDYHEAGAEISEEEVRQLYRTQPQVPARRNPPPSG